MNIKLDIPEKFFEGEELCGYYVSPLMKRVWAVELDILAEFARICEKHNIKWWMDAGTLLGAARHKGFIPWDDDVDVIMMRDEYKRFLEIAHDELKNPYAVHTLASQGNHFVKLSNEDTTMLGRATLRQMKEKGRKPEISGGIFIDVFPLDNVPDDEGEMKRLYYKLRPLQFPLAWKILASIDDYHPAAMLWKRPIKAACHYVLNMFDPFLGGFRNFLREKGQRSFKKFMLTLESLNYPNGKRIAKLVFANDPKFLTRQIWERSCFDDTVYLPFEMLNLPAPAGYEKILDHFYGNWHEFVRYNPHGGFYDTERSYTYYTQEGHIPE